MFRIKRPAIIGVLLILLIFTGYLNYQFTQQALRKTSTEYKKYEAMELQDFLNASNLEDNQEDLEIVDSKNNLGGEISGVVSASNDNMKDEIGKEVANLNRNYFVEQRLSRDKLRANLIDRLSDIINNTETNDKMRTEAQEEIISIGRISETELQIESLVKSKGFDEALALLTNTDIKIVVSAEELDESGMVKILEIVRSKTDFDMENINIIKKQ